MWIRRAFALASLVLLGAIGPAGWMSGALAEPKIIGNPPKDVRVLRGGHEGAPATDAVPESAVDPNASNDTRAASPVVQAAVGALESVRSATPPRVGSEAAKTLARRLIAGYGGPRSLQAWLEGGERRGAIKILRPARVEGHVVVRQRGQNMRLDLQEPGYVVTAVLSPDGGWQSMLGLVSDVADEMREDAEIGRAHDESLLLGAAQGIAPAAVVSTALGDALAVWGPRGSATVFLAAAGTDRLAAVAFRDQPPLHTAEVEHWIELGDWRRLDPETPDARGPRGTFVPFFERTAMDGLLVEESAFTAVDLLAVADDSVFARPGETHATVGAARRVTLPLERHGAHHFARVQLNGGPPRLFLVDTGAGLTAISRELADTLGLALGDETQVFGLVGGAGARSATLASVGMGDLVRSDVPCMVMDFSLLRSGDGESIEGILGFSALNRYAVTFDFARSQLEIAEHAAPTSAGSAGTRLRFQTLGGNVVVPGRLEGGRELSFVLDTGAGQTFVPAEAARALHTTVRVPGVAFVGADGRMFEGDAMRARSLSLGALRVDRPIVVAASGSVREDPEGITVASGLRGVLGGNVLRQFRLTLDYPRGEIILVPNAKATVDETDFQGPGVVVRSDGTGLVVRAVLAGTPAARAAVAVGDHVVSIDGAAVDGTNGLEGGVCLSGALGSSVTLRLRAKGGRERTMVLTRVRLL